MLWRSFVPAACVLILRRKGKEEWSFERQRPFAGACVFLDRPNCWFLRIPGCVAKCEGLLFIDFLFLCLLKLVHLFVELVCYFLDLHKILGVSNKPLCVKTGSMYVIFEFSEVVLGYIVLLLFEVAERVLSASTYADFELFSQF